MDQIMDLDSPTTWARVIAKRAALFKRVMPMAMENLSIAQHWDTLRYAHTQGGSYKSKMKQFDALATYGVVVFSPLANKVRSSSVLKDEKIVAWLFELL